MNEHMKKLGLYVTPYKVIVGIESLREYLKAHDNVYVKCSILRGDFETFHALNYRFAEPKLDEIEYKLGAMKHIKEFIVEEAYDEAVETGCDLYTVDGKYPTATLAGIEVKDLGYIGKINKYENLSPKVTDFNTKMAETLEGYGYRGFFSTEVRVSKTKPPYMLDFCARLGSPPNELYQMMYKNLAEIIWYGSQGYLIDPVYEHKYGVEVFIHSSWADQNWQEIEFPKKYRDNIKLRNACKINDKYYAVPQTVGLPEVGAIVAEGDNIKEVIEKVKEIADTIQGYYLEIKLDAIDTAMEQFKKLEEFGVKIL